MTDHSACITSALDPAFRMWLHQAESQGKENKQKAPVRCNQMCFIQ